MTTPIPQPPKIPFLGHAGQLEFEVPLRSFSLLSQTYGEIFELNMPGGRRFINVTSYALASELSDEKRFRKSINSNVEEVRHLSKDGLFTAYHNEENWGIAHRLLMPAFGTANVKNMLEDMRDICDQLLLKWERFGPEYAIDPPDDFSRVAFDAIALCSMSYRINSFYSVTPQPFVQAMADFLTESGNRAKRPRIVQAVMTGTNAKYEADMKVMLDVGNKITADRKAHPIQKHDLLNTMLYSKDPKTGKGLDDDNISRNLITFLIAGHETSSGLMSFIVYYLLKNPDMMRKLRNEIDTVVGPRTIQFEDLSKLPYLTAVMRETLRIAPSAPARSVEAIEDTVIGGKYKIPAGVVIAIHTYLYQRDPAVWGEDADVFKPERMMDGKFESLPPNAWQPFGFGLRACIGRPFAWQEVQLVIASVLQKFDLYMADPSYSLELLQTLTIKPKGFRIRAALRTDVPRLHATPSSGLKLGGGDASGYSKTPAPPTSAKRSPLYVLYGSNTGTSESFAQRIVNEGPSRGFAPQIGTLDSATGHLPTDGPVVIVTASFEGQPADNAAQFVNWLTNLSARDELKGVQFAVFGCGNTDWAQTYQRIPTLCDDTIEKHGGKRLLTRGAGDASQGDFFSIFDKWEAELWSTLAKEYSVEATDSIVGFDVKTVDTGAERAVSLRQKDAAVGSVVESKVLTAPGEPTKIHIEFKLPEGQTYRAGDYLAILPHNPIRDVKRVLSHFGLTEEHRVEISSDGPTSLPVGIPITVVEIVRSYVELSQPATSRDITILIKATESEATKAALQALKDSYDTEVLAKRVSVLDLVEKYSSDIKLSLAAFLRLLPPMRVRQYSISSSPLWNPEHATLTVSVIEAPALAEKNKTFLGVASTYLAHLKPGDRVQMAVRPSAVAFHPPEDPNVPVVMFCAGSGLAPLRGFIQERAMQKMSGRDVGPVLLFFGCRGPNKDYLYSDSDLKEWGKLGFLDVRPAFSRAESESEGCKYVQDRVWHDKDDVIKLSLQNAKFFTCGSGKIAKGIKAKLVDIVVERHQIDRDEAEKKLQSIAKDRYATDIFD